MTTGHKITMIYTPIDEIFSSSCAPLLDYPEADSERIARRCQELRKLNIDGLFSAEPDRATRQQILGLGYCGLVLLGLRGTEKVAIKLHRSDSTQPDLRHEAGHQRYANRFGVGPSLYAATGNILVMEYLPGRSLGTWLKTGDAHEKSDLTRHLIRGLLKDAFALDQAGLDHGALRCVAEHVIIDHDRATLIDFSHASRNRRAANVTTLIQGLFWGTRLAGDLGRALPLPDRSPLIPLLRRYKQQASQSNFDALLDALPF